MGGTVLKDLSIKKVENLVQYLIPKRGNSSNDNTSLQLLLWKHLHASQFPAEEFVYF